MKIARLVPAAVLSAAVVVSATAGSAVAAKLVTGADVKNGSLTSVDIKNKSLKGADVKPGSLTQTQLAPAVKKKLAKPNVVGYEVVRSTEAVEAGSQATVYVACTGDKIAVGGGGGFVDGGEFQQVLDSAPAEFLEEGVLFTTSTVGHADAWGVSVRNGTIDLADVTAYAICVDPS